MKLMMVQAVVDYMSPAHGEVQPLQVSLSGSCGLLCGCKLTMQVSSQECPMNCCFQFGAKEKSSVLKDTTKSVPEK